MFQWRKGHGLRLSSVAKRAKLSRETVAGLERGTAWYSLCVAARVCDAMGMWFGHAVLVAVRRIGRFPRGRRRVYWQ